MWPKCLCLRHFSSSELLLGFIMFLPFLLLSQHCYSRASLSNLFLLCLLCLFHLHPVPPSRSVLPLLSRCPFPSERQARLEAVREVFLAAYSSTVGLKSTVPSPSGAITGLLEQFARGVGLRGTNAIVWILSMWPQTLLPPPSIRLSPRLIIMPGLSTIKCQTPLFNSGVKHYTLLINFCYFLGRFKLFPLHTPVFFFDFRFPMLTSSVIFREGNGISHSIKKG